MKTKIQNDFAGIVIHTTCLKSKHWEKSCIRPVSKFHPPFSFYSYYPHLQINHRHLTIISKLLVPHAAIKLSRYRRPLDKNFRVPSSHSQLLIPDIPETSEKLEWEDPRKKRDFPRNPALKAIHEYIPCSPARAPDLPAETISLTSQPTRDSVGLSPRVLNP